MTKLPSVKKILKLLEKNIKLKKKKNPKGWKIKKKNPLYKKKKKNSFFFKNCFVFITFLNKNFCFLKNNNFVLENKKFRFLKKKEKKVLLNKNFR
jgi:hypothetical protein